jgi:GTPase SAR1 family protein
MDQWTVAVLGDGGVGKTALAVKVSTAEIYYVLGQTLTSNPVHTQSFYR